MVRNEDEGGRTEMVWTCHERQRVCRNGVTRKRGRPKRKFLNLMEDMREVGAKETDVEDRTVWRQIICCGYP